MQTDSYTEVQINHKYFEIGISLFENVNNNPAKSYTSVWWIKKIIYKKPFFAGILIVWIINNCMNIVWIWVVLNLKE